MDELEKIMARYPNLVFSFEKMPGKQGGLLINEEVTLNANISVEEQVQWCYEELGHYATTVGDISDYSKLFNQKQECEARIWGITHLIKKEDIEHFKKRKYDNDYEVASELGVTVSYLHEAGKVYQVYPYF